MPQRRQKPDPIISSDSYLERDAIALSAAIRPLDEMTARMEDKWGVDRLPGLVPVDLAHKWGRTVEAFERAMDAKDVDAAVDLAGRLIKGLAKLDAVATEAGHQPLPLECWPCRVDGKPAVVVRHKPTALIAKSAHPDAEVYTLGELVALAEAGIRAVKEHPKVKAAYAAFPDAKAFRPTTSEDIDDDIPF